MAFAGVFAVATAVNVSEQRKQAKRVRTATEKQASLERAIQGEEATRRRRTTIKEAAIKRAQIENIAGASGQRTGTAAVTSAQQVTGAAAQNIGQIQTGLSIARARTTAQQDIFEAQQVSPLQTISGVAQQAAIAFKS